jgi:hydroxymethylpyrimidine/phosphomethylpyrimidine kinase
MRRSDYIPLCTIAGSDPSGGAGLQGDLKTFAAHGARGTAVVTALTVQGARGVSRVEAVPPDLVAEQLAVVLEEFRPRALKTGMLWDGATIRAVAGRLAGAEPQARVIDPVLAASAGGALLVPDALPALIEVLLPLATVLTPNLPEAARLLGRAAITDSEAREAARALLALGPEAVLVKGGHGGGDEAVDWLATRRGVERFALPRVRGADPHGTGCALAAALAARLGRGEPLSEAVRGAKGYVFRALVAARGGPLVHAVPADDGAGSGDEGSR